MGLAIFRPQGFGTRLATAAETYLTDYVFSEDPDGPSADHDLTDFERHMLEDFLAGLFSDVHFSRLLQEAAAGMKAGGVDPEGADFEQVA